MCIIQWQFDCYHINPMLVFRLLLCLSDHMYHAQCTYICASLSPFPWLSFLLRYDCHNYIHTFDIEFQLDWSTHTNMTPQTHAISTIRCVVSFSDSGKINRINWRCTDEKIAIFSANNDRWTATDRTVCARVFIRAFVYDDVCFKKYFWLKKQRATERERDKFERIPEFYVRNEIPFDFLFSSFQNINILKTRTKRTILSKWFSDLWKSVSVHSKKKFQINRNLF